MVCHPLVIAQHPEDDIRDRVLGLEEGEGDGRHRGRSGEVWGVEDMRGMGEDDAQKAEK